MTEPLSLNSNPLNQLAKRLLDSPNPGYLYSLQLVRWALANLELVGPWAQVKDQLELAADQMLGDPPDQTLRLLTSNPQWKANPAGSEEAKMLEGKDQQEVATALLENLQTNLARRNPALRPATG